LSLLLFDVGSFVFYLLELLFGKFHLLLHIFRCFSLVVDLVVHCLYLAAEIINLGGERRHFLLELRLLVVLDFYNLALLAPVYDPSQK
jgi:hypothetical protein